MSMGPEKQTNENCLRGMKCPGCGALEPFNIECKTSFDVWDDGTEDHGDVEWEQSSVCVCGSCGKQGTVADFTIQEPDDVSTAEALCGSIFDNLMEGK